MPRIAITMGDPAGIGPEITVKALADPGLPERLMVVGDLDTLNNAASMLGLEIPFVPYSADADTAVGSNATAAVPVLTPNNLPSSIAHGVVSAEAGQAAFDYIQTAISLANAGEIEAIVTAPIHKEALAAAGVPYPGHTEMLAEFSGADDVAMMLVNNELRVVLVTIHCALRAAIDQISIDSVLRAIQLAHRGTRQFGIAAPRIAVAGLNPHAGEGGLFGDEEAAFIVPAIEQAQTQGMDASGPWPGDTVFMQARKGRFDVVVAQYHDQGLIPIKYMGIEDGVNVTLGLPFVRTSPDHGTAFDIAGLGIANPASLINAIHCAAQLLAGPMPSESNA